MLTINFLKLDQEGLNNLDFTTFWQIFQLMYKYRHKLFDDEYFRGGKPYMQRVYEIIEAHIPYFWLFYDTKTGETLGFCYLYDIVPTIGRIHSAFASICFKKEAFGMKAHIGAKRLLNHLFQDMNIFKIKAECYSDNHYTPNFLKKLGFEHEATLKHEVIVQHEVKSIEIWSVYNLDIFKFEPSPCAVFRPKTKGKEEKPDTTKC